MKKTVTLFLWIFNFSGLCEVNAQDSIGRKKDMLSQPDTTQLNTIYIRGKKPLVEVKNGIIILNVANSILATGNTAMQILARAPGVTVDQDGHINLRGKSGVNVMINGKSSYLSAEQLANFLRSMNGNTIESIEFMTQPPSRYDASGSAGIINIKLKKANGYGTNGSVTAGFGYGRFHKANGGINFNHKEKHFSIYGNYDYANTKEYEELKLKRSNTNAGELTFFNQHTYDVTQKGNNTYKAGIDYAINDRHILGIVFSGYNNKNTIQTENGTRIGKSPLLVDSTIRAVNPGRSYYRHQSYNLNYKASIDTSGQEINADVAYSVFSNSNDIVYNNYFYNPAGIQFKIPVIYRNATPSAIKIWSGKVDYLLPFTAKSKLETGLKSSYVHTDNNLVFESYSQDYWKNDPYRSNQFIYTEYVNAAYANFSKEFASTSLQIGLRAELTSSDGNSPTLQNRVKRNYFDLFPNLSLSHKFSEEHEGGMSYSRRIDRPDYHSLNPFIYFNDLFTYYQGNPLLKPQYTNSVELTYGYHKKLNFTLGYSHTKDVISTTLVTDTVRKTLYINDQNLASQHTYNLNVNMPVAITGWWNTANNATFYYTGFDSPDLMGTAFHSGKATYLLNTTQSFSISKSINAEASANYRSAQVYGTYAVKPLYSVDLGISNSFADNRASIKIAANDIFNLAKARISSAIALQDYQLIQKQESRIFRITFSYNFGNNLIKARKAKKNAADEEQQRVKPGN